jgi:hypothetical protein
MKGKEDGTKNCIGSDSKSLPGVTGRLFFEGMNP